MILTLKNIYSEVLCKLKTNNIEMPQLETQIILEHVTNLKLEKIYTNLNQKIYSKKINLIRKLTKRIIAGEPIQYVTQHAFFYSLKFFVSKDVLIPRPESETIVDLALKILESNKYKAPPEYKALLCSAFISSIVMILSLIKRPAPLLHSF